MKVNAAKLLRTLRERGYSLTLEGDELVLSGPRAPRDPAKAQASLDANASELAALLRAEQDPAVITVLTVFPGAMLLEVRPRPAAAKPGDSPAHQRRPH